VSNFEAQSQHAGTGMHLENPSNCSDPGLVRLVRTNSRNSACVHASFNDLASCTFGVDCRKLTDLETAVGDWSRRFPKGRLIGESGHVTSFFCGLSG
jgi:hypothetical protein